MNKMVDIYKLKKKKVIAQSVMGKKQEKRGRMGMVKSEIR